MRRTRRPREAEQHYCIQSAGEWHGVELVASKMAAALQQEFAWISSADTPVQPT
jgi:hypothetical protein